MWLSKAGGGCVVNGYPWDNGGDVTEVPDGLGDYLLHVQGHDYSVAEAPPKPVKATAKAAEPAKPAATGDGAPKSAAAAPAKAAQ
jgi:hypothetical protein